MSKNILYFHVKHWLFAGSIVLPIIIKFLTNQVPGNITRKPSFNSSLLFNETLCNSDDFTYSRDTSSSWYSAIFALTIAIFLISIVSSYLLETKEYHRFNDLKDQSNQKNGSLKKLKNEIESYFQKRSIDVRDPNKLMQIFEENQEIDIFKRNENIFLIKKLYKLYEETPDTITSSYKNYFFKNYYPISQVLYLLSLGLIILVGAEIRLGWESFPSLVLGLVSMLTQAHSYHYLHKPTKDLEHHIEELKEQYSLVKDEIQSITDSENKKLKNEKKSLEDKNKDLTEQITYYKQERKQIAEKLTSISQKMAIYSGLFSTTAKQAASQASSTSTIYALEHDSLSSLRESTL